MSSSEKLRIVMLGNDEALLQSVRTKIRELFAQVPMDLIIVETARKLIHEVMQNRVRHIVVDQSIPGDTIESLAQSIDRQCGDCSIFALHRDSIQPVDGVTYFSIPMKSWNDFADSLLQTFPIELQQKYNLVRRNQELVLALTNHSQKYRDEAIEKDLFFEIKPSTQRIEVQRSTSKQISSNTEQQYIQVLPTNKIANRIELAILVILIGASLLLWHFRPDESVISAQGLLSLLSALGMLGYFLGRSLKQLLVLKKD